MKTPIRALILCTMLAGGEAALAQSAADSGGDDDMILVVGTRFARVTADEQNAKALFDDARIAASELNETDQCIDTTALEIAQEYFNGLGRSMLKASHYYFVPDDQIQRAAAACEKLHGQPARAWVVAKTKLIAVGRVVPASYAQELEQKIR